MDFWEKLDKIIAASEIFIDRPKGSCSSQGSRYALSLLITVILRGHPAETVTK